MKKIDNKDLTELVRQGAIASALDEETRRREMHKAIRDQTECNRNPTLPSHQVEVLMLPDGRRLEILRRLPRMLEVRPLDGCTIYPGEELRVPGRLAHGRQVDVVFRVGKGGPFRRWRLHQDHVKMQIELKNTSLETCALCGTMGTSAIVERSGFVPVSVCAKCVEAWNG